MKYDYLCCYEFANVYPITKWEYITQIIDLCKILQEYNVTYDRHTDKVNIREFATHLVQSHDWKKQANYHPCIRTYGFFVEEYNDQDFDIADIMTIDVLFMYGMINKQSGQASLAIEQYIELGGNK